MQTATYLQRPFWLFVTALFIAGAILAPGQAPAQEAGYVDPSELYSREELAQMLAPIALYPDALLSQILIASTYPIEVVEADRWIKSYPDLQGDALDRLLVNRDWDPSVKALCHFPSILALMSERIAVTTDLGNAFLAQEAEVLDMVQELRARAHAQGHLASNARQQVIVEKETIIIQPVNPRVVYVPYYDPHYVYGPWWYPAYPPYYWSPARVSIGFGIFYWPAVHFSFSFGHWSHFNWPHRHVFFDVQHRPKFIRHDHQVHTKSGRWVHSPTHRRGVVYRDKGTAAKFGQIHQRSDRSWSGSRGGAERRDLNRDRSRRSDDRGVQGRQPRQHSGSERVLHRGSGSQTRDQDQVFRARQPRQGAVQRDPQRLERELRTRQPQLRDQGERNRQPRRDTVQRNPQQPQRLERELRTRQPQLRDQGERNRQPRRDTVQRNPQQPQRIERELRTRQPQLRDQGERNRQPRRDTVQRSQPRQPAERVIHRGEQRRQPQFGNQGDRSRQVRERFSGERPRQSIRQERSGGSSGRSSSGSDSRRGNQGRWDQRR